MEIYDNKKIDDEINQSYLEELVCNAEKSPQLMELYDQLYNKNQSPDFYKGLFTGFDYAFKSALKENPKSHVTNLLKYMHIHLAYRISNPWKCKDKNINDDSKFDFPIPAETIEEFAKNCNSEFVAYTKDYFKGDKSPDFYLGLISAFNKSQEMITKDCNYTKTGFVIKAYLLGILSKLIELNKI